MKIKLRGKIVTPSRIIENGDVCAENGIITYVGTHRNDDALYETADYGDRYIPPASSICICTAAAVPISWTAQSRHLKQFPKHI